MSISYYIVLHYSNYTILYTSNKENIRHHISLQSIVYTPLHHSSTMLNNTEAATICKTWISFCSCVSVFLPRSLFLARNSASKPLRSPVAPQLLRTFNFQAIRNHLCTYKRIYTYIVYRSLHIYIHGTYVIYQSTYTSRCEWKR